MNKIRLISVSLALLMFMSLSASAPALAAVEDKTDKTIERAVAGGDIGLLTPKTGALGFLGQSFEDGATLAISDLNAKYGANTFTLNVQDTQTDPTGASTAATALVTAGVLGVVGAAASSSTLSAMGVLAPASIPQISYASTSPAITTAADSGFLFRTVPSDALQGQASAALAAFAGIKSVAVIGIDDAYGQGLVNAFVAAFEADGGTVAANIAYDVTTTTDFTSQVTTLVNADTDAVYMVSFLTDGAAILNELSSQGFDGTVMGTDGIASSSIFQVAGVNASMSLTMGTAPTITGSDLFVADFQAMFGSSPGIFVAESYDATVLLGEAIMNATAATGTAVRDALLTFSDYEGASGLINFDSNGDLIGGLYDIWQVQTDATTGFASLVVVGEYNPGTDALGITSLMDQTNWPAKNTETLVTTTTVTGAGTTVTETVTVTGEGSTVTETPFNFAVFFVGIMAVGVIVRLSKRK